MPLVYIFIVLFFIAYGCYFIFVENNSIHGIHFLVLAMYFYVTLNDILKRPVQKVFYIILILLLLLDGILNFLSFPSNVISGFISIFFAYVTWHNYKRLKIKSN